MNTSGILAILLLFYLANGGVERGMQVLAVEFGPTGTVAVESSLPTGNSAVYSGGFETRDALATAFNDGQANTINWTVGEFPTAQRAAPVEPVIVYFTRRSAGRKTKTKTLRTGDKSDPKKISAKKLKIAGMSVLALAAVFGAGVAMYMGTNRKSDSEAPKNTQGETLASSRPRTETDVDRNRTTQHKSVLDAAGQKPSIKPGSVRSNDLKKLDPEPRKSTTQLEATKRDGLKRQTPVDAQANQANDPTLVKTDPNIQPDSSKFSTKLETLENTIPKKPLKPIPFGNKDDAMTDEERSKLIQQFAKEIFDEKRAAASDLPQPSQKGHQDTALTESEELDKFESEQSQEPDQNKINTPKEPFKPLPFGTQDDAMTDEERTKLIQIYAKEFVVKKLAAERQPTPVSERT
eukprot:GHVT01075227.1.p1 GENE.GHVT01075227.1~~GHVT01075227.1.p1  ORF type:complete len:407 (-),score=47.77 GHVT01075227.1:2528-3748(-)